MTADERRDYDKNLLSVYQGLDDKSKKAFRARKDYVEIIKAQQKLISTRARLTRQSGKSGGEA